MTSSEQKVVHIRRNVQDYGDPYLNREKPEEVSVCRECKCVYAGDRWQLESQAAKLLKNAKKIIQTLCPACQKIHDRMPGGIVNISGNFAKTHEQDIVNLLNNENERAMTINPIERIIDIEHSDDGLVVWTTNEKLAQRIGRQLYKAYRGEVEYHWSEDTKLARVYWRRD